MKNSATTIQCYYVEYNQDTKCTLSRCFKITSLLDTDNLPGGSTDDWAKYKTKEQNNIFSTVLLYL